MNNSQSLLPFMDILTALVGIIILMTIIFALSLSEAKTVFVRILHKKADAHEVERRLRPVYVECATGKVMIGQKDLPVPESEDDMRRLREIIETEMRLTGEGAFLFALVRPGGFRVFRQVRRVVDKMGIRLGYEPINSTWKLYEQ